MYQVLYRKYRPKVFSDVYGQDHVTSTLMNEIKENRISHAYLFTGSRGTGKTTCAKILAKAVNCEHGKNGEPCNECEVCRGLDAGTIYDVVEIDAASNNGVDNIRDLREEVNYTPTRGRYRVYIIDEVHMLSAGAFNALLKTLEEPPAHVIFILATTEVHKLPATILSRCQRFDFKRIKPETMAIRLKQVASLEGMELNDDAAVLIAKIADGAMRDALSILDQCAGRSKKIDARLVSEAAGIAGRESLYKLSDAVCAMNSGDALNIIAELYRNSYDMERLCVDMINHFRNFLIVKTVKKSRDLIICTDDEYNMIVSGTEKFTLPKIIFALDMFQKALTVIKGGANSRIEMEMSFIRLCSPKLDQSADALLDRIAALEKAVKNGVAVRQAEKPNISDISPKEEIQPKESEKTAAPAESQKNEKHEEPPKQENTAEKIAPITEKQPLPEPPVKNDSALETPDTVEFSQWGEFLEAIYKSDIALYGVLNGATGYIRDEFFLIDSQNAVLRQFIRIPTHSKAIKQALYDVTGKQFKLGLFKKKEEKPKSDPLEDLISKAQGKIDINIE